MGVTYVPYLKVEVKLNAQDYEEYQDGIESYRANSYVEHVVESRYKEINQ